MTQLTELKITDDDILYLEAKGYKPKNKDHARKIFDDLERARKKYCKMIYIEHSINEDEKLLEVYYNQGGVKDTKFFLLAQFNDWVEKEYADSYGVVWITYQDVYWGERTYPIEVDEYIKDNERQLVIEFWNAKK